MSKSSALLTVLPVLIGLVVMGAGERFGLLNVSYGILRPGVEALFNVEGWMAMLFVCIGATIEDDTPWTAREEWRTNEFVADTSVSGTLVAAAVILNMHSWPFAIGLMTGGAVGDVIGLVVIIQFSSAALAVVAAWPKIKAFKFGVTRLTLETMPGRLGQPLNAIFYTGIDPADRPKKDVQVSLTCYRRYAAYTRDSDGDSRETVKHDIIWRDEKTIRPRVGGDGTLEIPVSFRVPSDQPVSPTEKTEERILWELKAEADVSGIDFSAEFEIPIFEPVSGVQDDPKAESENREDAVYRSIDVEPEMPVHAASDANAASDVGSNDSETDDASFASDSSHGEGTYDRYEVGGDMTEPVSDGISVKQTSAGGLQVTFEAGRNWTGPLVLAVLALFFGGVGVAVLFSGVLFLGFGLVGGGVCSLYGAWYSATHASTVTIENGQVSIESGWLGTSENQHFPASQLLDARVSVNGQDNSRDIYDLKLFPADPDAIPKLRKKRESRQRVASFVRGAVGGNAKAEDRIEKYVRDSGAITVAQGLPNKQEADWIAQQILDAAERESSV